MMGVERLFSQGKLAYGTLYSILCNRMRVVPRPRMAYFLLTWKCNLRCVMCNVWKKELYPQLSTEDFLKVIGKLPFLDVVKIGGGEPFLRNDVPALVTAIKKNANPYYIMLITNGTMTERIADFAEQCAGPGLHLRLSFEGRGATHDKLRGREGCFDKTLHTLRTLLPIKRRKKFVLGINYNITPETIEDLPWIRQLCRDEGLNFIPGFWVEPFLEPGNPAESRAMVADFQDYRRRIEELYEQTQGVSPLEAYYIKKTIFGIYDEALNGGKKSFACCANRNIIYLLPNGDAVTCGIQHEPIGNLVDEDFSDIWYGAKARQARERVKDCPGCHQYAIKIMSKAYTGETFGLPKMQW